MIKSSQVISIPKVGKSPFDYYLYGLGFETRSTKLVSAIKVKEKIFALKMPESLIHAYRRNVQFAKTMQHRIIENVAEFAEKELRPALTRSSTPIRIGFDISSVNRLMLVEVISKLARFTKADDRVEVHYCPAVYIEPDRQFPQIQRLGPINPTFSSVDGDPTKPLCLILGLGFEAGLAMGIISQLEPQLTYCFWGTGVDRAFDRAVKRANFDFEFSGFNTKTIAYDIKDALGAFYILENVIYGLIRHYRVIIVPMGPKLFTFLSALVGMTYLEDVAIWRVQHSRTESPDSLPGKFCVQAVLDTELLNLFSQNESRLAELTY
jgi:hypothetical protein